MGGAMRAGGGDDGRGRDAVCATAGTLPAASAAASATPAGRAKSCRILIVGVIAAAT